MPTDKLDAQLTPRIFFNKVLAGTASGTIIALIPNAVLGAILKYFAEYKIIEMIIHAAQIFQLATPLIIGGLIAFQFGLTPQKMMIAGGAAFAGSGVIKFNSEVKGFIGAGTGDIINIMITASVAVLLLLVIDKKFGSVEIIALPIVVGVGAGLFGMLIYPYVTQITVAIGKVINNFTDFQPIIMSILIACSFSLFANIVCNFGEPSCCNIKFTCGWVVKNREISFINCTANKVVKPKRNCFLTGFWFISRISVTN